MFKPKLPLVLLVGAVATSRWVFRSHYLYDIDSVNFALAMRRFDPRVHQPHPPGYFLYVCLGRLLNTVFHDANLALVVLSILSSCGVAIVIYKITLAWFSPMAARFSGALFLLSPLAWFHGTVALTYIVEAFFSGLLGYLCWRIYCGNERFVLSAGIILGVSAGVRPSSLLFLAPLFLFSLWKATPKGRCIGLAALAVTLAAWFVPMIYASGGLKAYFGALFSLWRMVPSKETVFNSSPANSIARAFTIVFIYLLCFGAASLAPLVALIGRTQVVDARKKIFTLVWISPALCFFTFGYLKFVNSGYLLVLCAPACMWLGLWASEWYEACAWRKPLKLAVLGACAAVNVLIFLASPFYCSYREVRRFEADLESITTALPQAASARDTVIVSFDSHFNGFRHAGYYLPGYLTVEYPEAKLKEGARVFTMRERATELVTKLPVGSYTRFIVFPLPSGGSYEEYLQTIKGRLPSQSLQSVSAGGREFITGPISDLPLLFPNAAPAR
jgi:4-amino-4-deoxy-L-arabinose transferase-like glycosyltransferase